jgi:hypothetical protein
MSTGRSTPAASYFTDLQAMNLLICSTWPATRTLAPIPAAADAIDQHVDELERQATQRQAQNPNAPTRVMFDPPSA